MKEYPCENCGKIFKQKSHWTKHVENKKFPCVRKENKLINSVNIGVNIGVNTGVNCEIIKEEIKKKKVCCRFCLKLFSRPDSLKRHMSEERCEVLKLHNQQKENIFINLLEEEKIVTQTKKELNKLNKMSNLKKTLIEKEEQQYSGKNINQMDFLIKQIKLLGDKLEEQKRESEIQIKKQKIDTEKKLKIMTYRYTELEKNNSELKKNNEKLQTKMNKIVNKNKITNTNSNNIITNTVFNNPVIKLVNFGSEDLDKISHGIFIDSIKSQGAGLYNKTIEGIYFNKEHPENQNIYISDINRGKVMIYKDEKWFLNNWDNIYPELLEKIIQFGYDKNDFMKDCGYKIGDTRYNKHMIKNGMRWYKLLDEDEPDVEYFELDPEDRPEIDEEIYQDYLEMYNFRKRHTKKQTELTIKNKIKLNMYNKRDISINNYKQIEDNKKSSMIE